MKIPNLKSAVLVLIPLAAVGVFGWGWWWLALSVQNSDAVLQDFESRIAALEEERKSARQSGAMLERYESELGRIRELRLDRSNPIEFIESIEELGRKTGNFLSLGFDEARSKSGNLVFRLTVEGTAQSTIQYLRLLELMPYELTAEDLIFQKIPGGLSAAAPPEKRKVPSTHRLLITISVKAL